MIIHYSYFAIFDFRDGGILMHDRDFGPSGKSELPNQWSEMADGFCFLGARTVSNVFPKGIILF